MRRRELLTTSALLLAGCSSRLRKSKTTTQPTQTTRTTTEREVSTTPPKETTTTEQSQTTQETTTETLSEAETEAKELLSRADEHLGEAADAYRGFADASDATLLSVRPTTRLFDWHPVSYAVTDTWNDLDIVPDAANDDQHQRAKELRDVGEFLKFTARTQAAIVAAYRRLRKALTKPTPGIRVAPTATWTKCSRNSKPQ